MKSSKLAKIVLIMVVGIIMLLSARQSFAANNIAITDLTGTLNTNNTSVSNNTATVNNVLTTNNTSNYSNTALPNTGIEDSIPAIMFVVVFGISAVYAYKKIQDYKNI